jgi:hypothetical protein
MNRTIKVLLRIAVLAVPIEGASLTLLRRIPTDVGFPRDFNPALALLARIVVLAHYPALFIGFNSRFGASHAWWVFAFLFGYVVTILVIFAAWYASRSASKLFRRRSDFP